MQIRRYVGNLYAANCYVVLFNKQAIIIDPCVRFNRIKLSLQGLEIAGIFLTHAHADHFYCLDDIKKNTNAKIYCHYHAKEKIENANLNYSVIEGKNLSLHYSNDDYVFLEEDMKINIEDEIIRVIETPGHSNCSVCLIINDNVFTGDTLFYRSIGRTDLYSGNEVQMKHTLKRFKSMPSDYKLFPGHEQMTTLGDEIKNNPYLK